MVRVCSPALNTNRTRTQLGAESVKNLNKNNALQAVLFEAVGLVILLERDRELVEQMAVQLGRFIAAKEPNTRCVYFCTCVAR